MKPHERPTLSNSNIEHSYAWLFKRQLMRRRIRVAAFVLATGTIALFALGNPESTTHQPVKKEQIHTSQKTNGQTASTKLLTPLY